jgi:transcriptional regulator NrdR family protein
MSRPPAELPTVFVDRPRCPSCDGIDLKTTKSIDQGDGSTLRRTRCRECGCKFHVVVE